MPTSLDRVDLSIQRADLLHNEARLRAALQAVPGVAEVQSIPDETDSLAARVRVTFDAGQTNPVVFEDALAKAGITVLSADEVGRADS